MKKLSKEKFKEIILKQFEIASIEWVTFEALEEDKDWLNKYTYTEEENEEWLEWLRKELKWYTLNGRLEKEVQWINLDYWLKIKWNKKNLKG